MKFKDEDFGAKIIETITSGLYDGNPNCLREYVQNSIDSGAKNIEIFFENGNEDIVIKDDGYGMDKNELERSLSIGISDKSADDVGWRGIGIWSGVPACKRIVIITKKKNNHKYRIVIDNNKLRKLFESNKKATDVLSEITGDPEKQELGKNESFENQHFTTVRLESILPTQRPFLNEKRIPEYLSEVVPAPFDGKKFLFAKDINKELKKRNIRVPEVNIVFNKEKKIYRPPFKSDIFYNKLIFNEFEVKSKKIAFGWYLCTSQNQVLKKPNKGIFFKKKGFTIGDEYLVSNQYEYLYNPWQYGEIHIISDELRENAPRNNFEYNNEIVDPFLRQIGKYVGQLQTQNRYQSDKIIEKRIKKIKKHIEKGEISTAKKEIKKAKESIKRKQSFPKNKSLEGMKSFIDTVSKKEENTLVNLDKQVKQTKSEGIDEKAKIQTYVDCLPKPYQYYFGKVKKNWLEPQTDIMEPIVKLIKQKTGSSLNDLPKLSRFAFGWDTITESRNKQKLTITNGIRPWRDQCFGVMINSIHELFVNPTKHEKGQMSFEWFEHLTEDERKDVMLGVYSTLGLMYKIIEKSKFRQP